jgi:hypothetical protein
MRKYRHDKYWADPEKSRAYLREHNKKRREIVLHKHSQVRLMVDLIKDVPCMDCGGKFPPYVMDFDHVRGGKRFNIGSQIGRKLRDLLDEIGKCDIVCANCHRIRTDGRDTY